MSRYTHEELSGLIRDAHAPQDAKAAFRRIIYDHYKKHGRALPWRNAPTPYEVFVSEIMLQQTQVERVVNKFPTFLARFPDFRALADSTAGEVVAAWQGMGYNRRALSLHRAAKIIVEKHGGALPIHIEELEALPGIGKATARSIAAFAFNEPVVFIETNIRSVFIHFFFPGAENVPDAEILPLVERTLDRKNPSRWYNALMDYGVMLKKENANPSRKSAAYRPQAPFKNSRRQKRGRILARLVESGPLGIAGAAALLGVDIETAGGLLDELEREGFIRKKGRAYVLS
ncbi:MAG: A/G-specific adenine glycosylase [Spirochaetes bacterium]|nr:MAG: A/G-specific adenine glycosylase [Spirochaetota bacterium]